MPELTIALPTTLGPAQAVAASASGPDAAADAAPVDAFAALIQQLLAGQAASGVASSQETQMTAEAPAAEAPGIAALFPMLINAASQVAADMPVDEESQPSLAGETDQTGSPDGANMLAVTFQSIQLATAASSAPPPTQAAKADIAASVLPATANTTAILAATEGPDVAATANADSQGSFENLLMAAREVSANIAGQAPPAQHVQSTSPTPVATPVGAQGWDAEIGDRLVWMAGRHESRAELVLNPPQMGRIEVSLTVTGDQATATFVTASPAVREALENALPRLREALLEAGINLGQTQVGAESAGQSASDRENGDNSRRGQGEQAGNGEAAPIAATSPSQWLRGGRGMVDIFA